MSWFTFDDLQVEETPTPGWVSNHVIDPNVLPTSHPVNHSLPSTMNESSIITAKLFLFSPKEMFNHKVRPHIYDFKSDNDGMVAMMNNFQHDRPLINDIVTSACPHTLNMVRPTMNGGHIVNLKKMSECWTFVLIIDQRSLTGFNAAMVAPVFRHICTGYCNDEPVNIGTLTPNLLSEFRFCHHTTFEYKENRFGKLSSPNIISNHDIIPSEFIMAGLSVGEPFTQLTPTNMQATGPYVHALKTFGSYSGDLSLAPTLTPGTNPKIDASIKFGKSHLQTIGRYMLAAKQQTAEYNRKDRFGIPNPVAGEDYATAFYNLLSSSNSIVASGFGVYEFMKFQEMKYLLPPLEVVPIVTTNPRNWEVLPSELNISVNYFNSWIADSIAFICETCGITNFSVSYDSYSGNRFEKEGRWRVHKFETAHGDNREEAIHCFEVCKNKIEADLFTPIRYVNGEFDLAFNYRLAAETIIDLKFKDDASHIDALYEHPTQLGGWISPNVGSIDLFQENSTQLQELVNCMANA